MKRTIITIDEAACTGCGLCAEACHEGAIAIVDGKAKLIRDDYCDGLGNCLPVCPVDAIHVIEREAAAYDEAAVKRAKLEKLTAEAVKNVQAAKKPDVPAPDKLACGCPGTHSKRIERHDRPECGEESHVHARSMLSQWPVQIKLVPVNAPYFDGARLLVAADCTAYAYGAFHENFIKNHITLVGCPKLDSVDYSEKLAEIIRTNDIKSVTVVRMEVPCCGGLENAVKKALQASGKFIPWQVVTISTDGRILDR